MQSRERFLAACAGQPVDRTPVWLMRQAGRFLPEYRELRARLTFWEMVRTPELAVEATLLPIRRFGMDAAVLFCDILVVLDAMGAEVQYAPGGPKISPLFESEADLARLRQVDAPMAFSYVAEAIRGLCQKLHPNTAVLGFAGAPFTLAAYLVEGGPSRTVESLKALAYNQPALYDQLLRRVAACVADLLRLQIEAGADAVQLFDTWACHLCPEDYRDLALPYTKLVFEKLADFPNPKIHYLRNAAGHLEAAAESGCTVLSVDQSIDLAEARRRLPPTMGLQGNLDPAVLKAPAELIRSRVAAQIAAAKPGGYVLNLGQGLVPSTPLEGVQALMEAVRAEV